MKKNILDILVCPVTYEPFILIEVETVQEQDHLGNSYDRIMTGFLVSSNSKMAYPILKGIPRLLKGAMFFYKKYLTDFNDCINKLDINPNSYLVEKEFINLYLPTLKSFGKEWKEHNVEGKTWGWSQPERLKKYMEYMNIQQGNFEGKLFLDVGAGSGQLTCTLAESLNCDIIGVDLTLGIQKGEMIRRSLKNKDKLFFIQANLMALPFKNQTFDYIHASGVLHHTPNTEKAFNSVEKYTKSGGKFGVWIYRTGIVEVLPLIPFVRNKKFILKGTALRKITTKLNPTFLYVLIYLYAAYFHFFYKLNSIIRGKKHKQTIRERTTSLFDSLSPQFDHKHSPSELVRWFEDKDYTNLIETDQEEANGFNICAVKK